MSIFDQLLGQISSNVDIKGLAAKVGIDPAMAESAIAALTAGHAAPTDTVETAAASSGIDSGILQRIVGQIGGEGSLGSLTSMLGQNPDAMKMVTGLLGGGKQGGDSPLGGLGDLASGLFKS
jgi:ethanolamine utilization microcompartment shell protein EutS